MALFNFNNYEILTLFAVLVRFSILFALFPWLGDRVVPAPVKVLLPLLISLMLFPSLVASGMVRPDEARYWSVTAGGIVGTIAIEVIFGLILGFSSRLVFEGISLGANLIGNFMGFAVAASYDPHQESQSAVVAQIQMALAMLLFLVLNGHHMMLEAALGSYKIVGLGRAEFNEALTQRFISMTQDILRFGLQLSAPFAISVFGVNIIFGVLAKTMPQLNVLVLSMAVTALMGLVVLFLCMPELQGMMGSILARMGDWMESVMRAMAPRV